MWLWVPRKNAPLALTKNIKQAILFTLAPLGNETFAMVDYQSRSSYVALDQTMRPKVQMAAASGLAAPLLIQLDARGAPEFAAGSKQCVGVDWQLSYNGPKLYFSPTCNATVTRKLQKLYIATTSQSCSTIDK
jgi:hypothetical protein